MDKIRLILCKIVNYIFVIFLLLTMYNILCSRDENNLNIFYLMTISFAFSVVVYFFVKFYTFSNKLNLSLIFFITFIPRIFWVLKLKNLLALDDSKTYYILADAIAHNTITFERYISIFPHVLGYPLVLSLFYRVFGSHIFLGQILNVIFSIIIGFEIYFIGKKMFNEKIGFIASITFAVFPSQIYFTSMLVTEYLYMVFILGIIVLYLNFTKIKVFKSIIFYSIIGLFISLSNFIRPVSIILLLTIIIIDLLFQNNNKKINIYTSVILVLSFIMISKIIAFGVEKTINEKIAESSGWTLYIGANIEKLGGWNKEDADYFTKLTNDKTLSAIEINKILTDKAIVRYKEDLKNPINFLLIKNKRVWGTDFSALSYIGSALHVENKKISKENMDFLRDLANYFYYCFLFITFFTTLPYLKKANFKILFFQIYVLGIMAMELLAEGAPRYHFVAIAFLCVIFAHNIVELSRLIMYKKGKLREIY